MAERPVSYLQTDPRWAALPYAAAGERTTVGGSGCGPTAMAMILATWADPVVTPATECAWAQAHGYKARGRGTYYGYFEPAAARYGVSCRRVNGVSLYGDAGSPCHDAVKAALDRGCLVIACMGKGLWTSAGHFVLAWGVSGGTVYLNDPASSRAERTRGDWSLFRRQVKYYWIAEPPRGAGKEERDMTEGETRALIRAELADRQEDLIRAVLAAAPRPAVYETLEETPAWARDAVARRLAAGALEGTGHGLGLTREMLRLWVVEDRMRSAAG